MSLSLQKPNNEPLINYRGDDAAWSGFQKGLAGIPKGFDVPMIIDGEDTFSSDKADCLDPSTGQTFCTVQRGTAAQATLAIEAAERAKAGWAALPIETRIQKFRDLEWILMERRHEICAVTAHECGYIAPEVSGGWAEMIDFFRFHPYYLQELASQKLGDGDWETNRMQLRPLKGFTCAITPFNFPIAIGYNLPGVMALCGSTVVWKPSSDAPMTSWMFMKAIEDAGFPPGVINMITGAGPSMMAPILAHQELTALNFTGSYNTARVIGKDLFGGDTPRPHFPRFVAETGGKDFLVIDKECDVWDVASCIIAGAFGRSGQKCSANSLVLPHKSIWPDLKAALVEQMKSFRVKNPLERDSDMGPVISRRAYDKIIGFMQRAEPDSNVTTLHGGDFSDDNGFWISPTIYEVDKDDHELLAVEIFGPITAVRPVDDIDHAVRIIENHPYRLTGGFWSHNETLLDSYVPVLSQLAGNFYVNRKTTGAIVDQQPFGGDGASGTNYKAGSAWYLLQFLSQGTITRRHSRTLQQPGTWGWNR